MGGKLENGIEVEEVEPYPLVFCSGNFSNYQHTNHLKDVILNIDDLQSSFDFASYDQTCPFPEE